MNFFPWQFIEKKPKSSENVKLKHLEQRKMQNIDQK